MNEYRVTWEADITATDPIEAAKEARAMQTRPGTMATVFEVWPAGEADDRARDVVLSLVDPVRVDLAELEQAEGLAVAQAALKSTPRQEVQNCQDCDTEVIPDDPYYATPCGTFCSECMMKHAKDCGICASEFDLEPEEAAEDEPTVDAGAESDTATILAALRLFQRTYADCDAATIRAEWPQFDQCAPLGSEDIDALCERINCGATLPKVWVVFFDDDEPYFEIWASKAEAWKSACSRLAAELKPPQPELSRQWREWIDAGDYRELISSVDNTIAANNLLPVRVVERIVGGVPKREPATAEIWVVSYDPDDERAPGLEVVSSKRDAYQRVIDHAEEAESDVEPLRALLEAEDYDGLDEALEELEDEDGIYAVRIDNFRVEVNPVPAPRVVITVEGGMVTDVLSNVPVEAVTIDYDTDGGSDLVQIPQGTETEGAAAGIQSVDCNPARVEELWNAVLKAPAKPAIVPAKPPTPEQLEARVKATVVSGARCPHCKKVGTLEMKYDAWKVHEILGFDKDGELVLSTYSDTQSFSDSHIDCSNPECSDGDQISEDEIEDSGDEIEDADDDE